MTYIGVAPPPNHPLLPKLLGDSIMTIKTYKGLTNVSGAVALDERHFVVAGDEDNRLGVFEASGGKVVKPTIALSKVYVGEIQGGKHQEIDLEGAARLGDLYFWIGSHSTSSQGHRRDARHRLFAVHITEVEKDAFAAQRYGSIYTQLIADLHRDERFAAYGLARAERLAPKSIGGLSIEGLAATPAFGLFIGFRNPLAGGRVEHDSLIGGNALLVHLLNPLALLQGQAAQFASPIELDLDGLGIRDIAWRHDHQYLIVAGPYHANQDRRERHRLYAWDSASGQLQRLDHIELGDLNIEAAFFFPGQTDRVELLTDDGETNGFRRVTVSL